MNSYKKILILHALDKSTSFLSEFRDEFRDSYFSFDSSKGSIDKAKLLLGDLEPKSLIVYLGHGSSSGLYEPDDNHIYENYFLNTTWGNYYFEEHDVFLLSCRSNEYIRKIYKSNSSIGFGNIISSKPELEMHNANSFEKLYLHEEDIIRFNKIYVSVTLKIIKKVTKNEIQFVDIPKYLRFLINKEINQILMDKNNVSRLFIARLLFDFRNELSIRKNPQP